MNSILQELNYLVELSKEIIAQSKHHSPSYTEYGQGKEGLFLARKILTLLGENHD